MDRPGPDAPLIDLATQRVAGVDADDIEEHHTSGRWRQHDGYIDLKRKGSSKRRSHPPTKKRGDTTDGTKDSNYSQNEPEEVDAAERVKFLLGRDADPDDDETYLQVHDVFCELDELRPHGDDGEVFWKEAARWVKFEEDVEEGGERWSKPYVATLSLRSLYALRKTIINGTVSLDVEAENFYQITDLVLDKMIVSKQLDEDKKELVQEVLLSKHWHQHDKKGIPKNNSFDLNRRDSKGIEQFAKAFPGRLGRRASMPVTIGLPLSLGVVREDDSAPAMPPTRGFGRRGSVEVNVGDLLALQAGASKKGGSKSFAPPEHLMGKRGSIIGGIERDSSGNELFQQKFNKEFLKKIPAGAEVANVLVGEVDFLDKPITAFVRLKKSIVLGELTEVPLSSRFVFFLLGPSGHMEEYHQLGRAVGTLMSDEIFHGVMYKARDRNDILIALDEFLNETTVLPPSEWDPSIRIEPPKSVPSQDARRGKKHEPHKTAQDLSAEAAEKMKAAKEKIIESQEEEEEESEGHTDPTLMRTGRLFGGLINDLKRKLPWFPSDMKDALHIQCIASLFFMYFACLTPIITFGGLLGAATDNNLAAMESLLAGALCGITYHLFSGQPLTIIGSTGPVLIFETIVFNFTSSNDLNYLGFRFWIGLWVGIALILIVAFDLSALVRFITRFTEESFAMLISLIFIVESFKKLFHILDHNAVNLNPDVVLNHTCDCLPPNVTMDIGTTAAWDFNVSETPPVNWTMVDIHDCEVYGGSLIGPGCHLPHYKADVFFWSCLLFLGTFTVATKLKAMKTSRFFPTKVRAMVANFGVMISIVLMAGIDIGVGLDTPKLVVPSTFKPTRDDRGWVVDPFANPAWCIGAALPPAILATILIFMDQQITAVIINRKENLLKKGGGYHLDLFVIAIQIIINSILGLPWFVAATVLSINHVVSLTKESESAAPGERPKFLGIREQRVTGVITFIMVGVSVTMTSVLQLIPMAVLYGVFLFMGISALVGVQLVQRISIIAMPVKYQPDYVFLRHVPLRRTHLFTLIQVICLACLWTIKSIKSIAIIFPIMVLAMCFIRKALDKVFTQHELKWLDDIMPESKKKEKEESKQKLLDEVQEEYEQARQKYSFMGMVEAEKDSSSDSDDSSNDVVLPLSDGKTINFPSHDMKNNIWSSANKQDDTDNNQNNIHKRSVEFAMDKSKARREPIKFDDSAYDNLPKYKIDHPV